MVHQSAQTKSLEDDALKVANDRVATFSDYFRPRPATMNWIIITSFMAGWRFRRDQERGSDAQIPAPSITTGSAR